MEKPSIPLVYLCSDCSNAAQMANQLAIRLDRTNLAMSCIAARPGDMTITPSFDRTSKAGRVVGRVMGILSVLN